MTKKRRSVLMSAVTFMLCLALVAGGTYALFSDQVTLTTHLQAGTMDITLERINLENSELDPITGFLAVHVDPETVDFSKPNAKNVFDIVDNDLIVPGCSYDATMRITNNTDVAFSYWIEIIDRNNADIVLGDQLAVTVKADNYKETVKVSQGMFIGNEAKPVGVLAKGQSADFNVVLEFLNLNNNNAAMGQNLNFDIVVHAVQVVNGPNLK